MLFYYNFNTTSNKTTVNVAAKLAKANVVQTTHI